MMARALLAGGLLFLSLVSLTRGSDNFDVRGSNIPPTGAISEEERDRLSIMKVPEFLPADYDVREVPKRFRKAGGATQQMAWSFFILLIVISGFRFVMKASAGENAEGLLSLWQLLLVVGALLGYDLIFTGIFELGWLVENAILSEPNFEGFMDQMKAAAVPAADQKSVFGSLLSIVDLTVPRLLSAAFSFLVWVVYCVLILARYVFGAILYVAGPLLIVAALYKPCVKILNALLLGLIQVALWVPFIRIVAVVFQQEIIYKLLATQNTGTSTAAGFVAITLLCLVIIILAPIIVARTVKGDALGGLALAATVTMALVSKYAIKPVTGAIGGAGQASLPGVPGQAGMASSSRWAMFATQSASSLRNAIDPGAAQVARVKQSIAGIQAALKAETASGKR